MTNSPRSGDRFKGIVAPVDGIVWELLEDPIGIKCMAVLIESPDNNREIGEEYIIVNGVWTQPNMWQYLGNFGKSNRFKNLYDKLSA